MSAHGRTLLLLAALAVLIAGLHFAHAFFVPVLLAAILASLTAPIANSFTRRGAPPIVGAIVAIVVNIALVGGIGLLLARAAGELQEKVPSYVTRLNDTMNGTASALTARGIPVSQNVITRAIHAEGATAMVGAAVAEVLDAASSAAVVLLLVFFGLCEIVPLGQKLRAMFDDPESGIARVERIVHEVRIYLLIKTLTSLAMGVVVLVLLTCLRVDLALLLAVIMFLLHFIPNVGAPMAAVPAFCVALAQRGPGVAAVVLISYIVAAMIVGNVVEPRVLGRTMGLSPLVVLLSILLWGSMWGAAGALLSVPLTMVMKIVLQNDSEWSFIARLLDPSDMMKKPSRESIMSILPTDAEAERALLKRRV